MTMPVHLPERCGHRHHRRISRFQHSLRHCGVRFCGKRSPQVSNVHWRTFANFEEWKEKLRRADKKQVSAPSYPSIKTSFHRLLTFFKDSKKKYTAQILSWWAFSQMHTFLVKLNAKRRKTAQSLKIVLTQVKGSFKRSTPYKPKWNKRNSSNCFVSILWEDIRKKHILRFISSEQYQIGVLKDPSYCTLGGFQGGFQAASFMKPK